MRNNIDEVTYNFTCTMDCEIFIDALLYVRAFVHLLMWVSSTQPIHNTQQMKIKLFSLRHLNDLGFSYVMERIRPIYLNRI